MRTWRAACLLTLAAVLTACGSGGSGGDAGRPAAGIASLASAGTGEGAFNLVHDSEAAAAFVTAFRMQFPALAEGRTDAAIRDDVTHVCVDDIREGGDTLALTRIPSRFARVGIALDQHTALGIMNLAKATACQAVPTR
jgi:hypothetical protein